MIAVSSFPPIALYGLVARLAWNWKVMTCGDYMPEPNQSRIRMRYGLELVLRLGLLRAMRIEGEFFGRLDKAGMSLYGYVGFHLRCPDRPPGNLRLSPDFLFRVVFTSNRLCTDLSGDFRYQGLLL